MAQAGTRTRMTAAELAGGIRRAHAQFAQEMTAAKAEYDEARRTAAAKRKTRVKDARLLRDSQIQALREQFARERGGYVPAAGT